MEIYVTKKRLSWYEFDFFYYNDNDDKKDLEYINDILNEFNKSKIAGIKGYKKDIQKLMEYTKSYPKFVLKYYREVYEKQVEEGYWTSVITWD